MADFELNSICASIYFFRFLTPGCYVVTMVLFARESFSFVSKPTVFRRRRLQIIFSPLRFWGIHVREGVSEIRERFLEIFSEEFVRRSLIASPLIKPLLTPGGGQEA